MDNGKSSDPFVEVFVLFLIKFYLFFFSFLFYLKISNFYFPDFIFSRCISPSSKEDKAKFETSVKWKTLDPEYQEVSFILFFFSILLFSFLDRKLIKIINKPWIS